MWNTRATRSSSAGTDCRCWPVSGPSSTRRTGHNYILFSRDLFALAAATTDAALAALPSAGGARGTRQYPDFLEYVGWCSWDAFYEDVNAAGVLAKAAELKSLDVPIRWFLIDAGWSDDLDFQLEPVRRIPANSRMAWRRWPPP